MIPIAIVGTAEVTVVAITTGIKKQIKDAFREARPEMAKEGQRYGKAFGNKFRIQLKDDVKKAFRENRDWIKAEGARQGKLFSAEFVKSLSAELRAKLPGTLDNAFGDAAKHGGDWGKEWADAAKKSIQTAPSIRPEDIVPPVPTPTPGGGGGAGPRRRRPAEEDTTTPAGVRASRRAFAELEALAQQQAARLQSIADKSADDAVRTEQAKVDRINAEYARRFAYAFDIESEILTRLLQGREQEEGIAQMIADFSRARNEEAQAQLDETIAKLALARRQMEQAQLSRGGRRAAREELRAAEEQYNTLRDLSDRQAVFARQAELEAEELARRQALAVEAIRDRELDLDKARQQKKSTAAAQAAVRDARVAEDAARRQAETADRFRQAAADRAVEDAQRTAEALQRLDQARALPRNRISSFQIREARRVHEELKRMADEAERDRDEANSRALAAAEELAAREIELAQRKDDLLAARGRARAAAQRALDAAAVRADEARTTVQGAQLEAARTVVRHERIVVDVDRSKLRLDLSAEGRRAAGSFGSAFSSKFLSEAQRANDAFTRLFAVGNTLGAAIGGAVAGVSALVSSLATLVSVASEAAGALVVLPSILGALGQAGITAAIAFSGVGKAIGAGFQQAGAAAGGGTKAAVGAANRVADARQSLSRVYEDNARRIRDANRSIADAEENLIKTQNRAKIAQAGLTAARERAIESLEDLAFDLESAGLAEERSILNLQRASKELAEVQTNPASTIQDIQEASLNYREAELQVRINKDRLEDLEKAQDAANKAGVEGSKEVVDAQNDIIDANNDVLDAEERLQRAREDMGDVQVQNARAIQDAQERLSEALAAQGAAAGGAAGGVDAYQQALAELSPEARSFVELIVGLKDEFKLLKAAAGEELFPKLESSVRDIVDNVFPPLQDILRSTGGAIGDFANDITDVVSGEGFLGRLGTIADDNITTIQRFGEIFGSVISGVSGILVAAGPLVDRFTGWLEDVATKFERFAASPAGIETMTGFFERAGDAASQIGTIFGNLATALGNIGVAALPAGHQLLDLIEQLSERFDRFTQSAVGQEKLTNFFFDVNENAKPVYGLLGDIVGILGKMGAAPGIGKAAQTLRTKMVPALEEMAEKLLESSGAFAELVASVADLLNKFMDSGAVTVFFQALDAVVDVLRAIFEIPGATWVLGIITGLVALGKAIAVTEKTIGFFVKSAIGGFENISGKVNSVKGAFDRNGAAATALKTKYDQMAAAFERAAGRVNTAAGTVATATGRLRGAAIAAGTAPGATGGQRAAGAAAAGVTAVGKGAARATAGLAGAVGGLSALMGGPLVLGLTAATAAFGFWQKKQADAKAETEEFNATVDELTGSLTMATVSEFVEDELGKLSGAMENGKISTGEFMAAISQGDEGLANLKVSMEAAGATTENIDRVMDLAQKKADIWADKTGKLRKAWEDAHPEISKGEGFIRNYRDQAGLAAASVDEFTDASKSLKRMQDLLNGSIEKAIKGISFLNEEKINEEDANLRIHQSQLTAKKDLEDILKGIKDNEDASADQIRTSLEKARTLSMETEEGIKARGEILDRVKAMDDFAQSQLEMGAATEDVNATWSAQREALLDAAEAAGISRDEVDKYIKTIETTPEERQTKFKVLIDEQSKQRMIGDLDALSTEILLRAVPDIDTMSLRESVNAAIDTAIVDPRFQLTPEISRAGFEFAKEDLKKLLIDEATGKPYKIEMFPEAVQSAVTDIQKQIDEIVAPGGVPRDINFLPEPDKQKLNDLNDAMLGALINQETGQPYLVRFASEEIKDQLTTVIGRMDAAQYADPSGKVNRLANFNLGLAPGTRTNLDNQLNDVTKNQRKIGVTAAITDIKDETTADQKRNIFQRIWGRISSFDLGERDEERRRASGGPVIGPGGPTSDKVGPFMLSNGEFVLSAKTVQALGGMSAVSRINKRITGLQEGGTVLPRPGGTLTLLGEAGAAERVEPLDIHGLSEGDRAIIKELKDLKRFITPQVNIQNVTAPTPTRVAGEIVTALRDHAFEIGQPS